MKHQIDGIVQLSAGDLSNHIACSHLTFLDLSAAKKLISPPEYRDPMLAILQERGVDFEKQFLQSLRNEGLEISEVKLDEENAYERTISLMQDGVDVIYQAALKSDIWNGRADFLLRTNHPSNLGEWSYEVADSKLARETRTGTLLQLSFYSELVSEIQGVMPESMYVITPEDTFTKHAFRLNDYLAYYRFVKQRLVTFLGTADNQTYPSPVGHCDICRWWQACDNKRRNDDHLSFVAGLQNSHTAEMKKWEIYTLQGLAQLPLPLAHKPSRGAVETFERLREQARVQLESRVRQKPIYEFLETDSSRGLGKLPIPSVGDMFFDFEGDPFVGTTGLEYLFGFVLNNEPQEYYCYWSLTSQDEKSAFERFVDLVIQRWEEYPDMHIYHFTAYEPATLKRLMGKYATRENEIDRMLRSNLFIDLHTITKQALRAGIESYSLKELEKFHGFERELELRFAAQHIRVLEGYIERNNIDNIPEEAIEAVQIYNKEDCLSTKSLREWLEGLREQLIKDGNDIQRPVILDGVTTDSLTEYQQKILPVFESLLSDVPVNLIERDKEQQAKWLLAHMLDWYRREKKATWWEYFRLRDLPESELIEEKSAISGLSFTGQRTPDKRSVVDLYQFGIQECDLRAGDELKTGEGDTVGTVASIDTALGQVEIKKGPSKADIHPISVFKHSLVNDGVKEDSIFRIASSVVANGIDSSGPYRAGRDILLNLPPRTIEEFKSQSNPQEKAVEWVQVLDSSVIPIQGPPGAGKSHTAANMILTLIRSGKKVGITALSHKVIIGLMNKVIKLAHEQNTTVKCMRKVTTLSEVPHVQIEEITDNNKVATAIKGSSVNILGGTPWLWAREDMFESVDFLFVDEAGQLSLIDTIAVSQAAKNLVLLGDPQQLKQPQQGSHPEGTEVSSLEHILQGLQTIIPERGIFLNETWRLHPSINSFISELFYESKLDSREGLINQELIGETRFAGSGLWFESVNHEGNQSSSTEEADHVARIVRDLLNGKVFYIDNNKIQKAITEEDILIIAPYNSQVAVLKNLLPNVQVGTVDKFQGQEAPIVIFSMSTSCPEDAPRGMEFLYSLNRLNVAASRAKATFILVASPKLFEPDCKNIPQMKLANAFCRFREMVNTN